MQERKKPRLPLQRYATIRLFVKVTGLDYRGDWSVRENADSVKGGVILGHGVLMFSDSVLPNWSARMMLL